MAGEATLDHVLADLLASCSNLERARKMLTEAAGTSTVDKRRLILEARHTLGSAMQTLQLAIDEVRQLKVARAE